MSVNTTDIILHTFMDITEIPLKFYGHFNSITDSDNCICIQKNTTELLSHTNSCRNENNEVKVT